MKRPIELSLSLISLLGFIQAGYYEVSYRADYSCYDCIGVASVENWICKDNIVNTRSYCCLEGEDMENDKECDRDFCSTDALVDGMKMYACPYIYQKCGNRSPEILAILEEP
jgi:hypothetical protein